MREPRYESGSPDSLFPAVVETERLRLERLCAENVDPLALYGHLGRSDTIAEETRHLDWTPHDTPELTSHVVGEFEEQWMSGDRAGYVVRPRTGEDAGEFAGTATLTPDWDRRSAEFGIYLRKPYWGRGYAAERAVAFAHLAFERLDLEVVEVVCAVDNDRARRAIERYVDDLGGEYVGVRYNALPHEHEDPMDAHLYAVTREQYRAEG